jgi:hypothetical protein
VRKERAEGETYFLRKRNEMNFIKINGSYRDEELINLSMVENIYKENKDLDWKDRYGIVFIIDDSSYETYFTEEIERDKYFEELEKKLTI